MVKQKIDLLEQNTGHNKIIEQENDELKTIIRELQAQVIEYEVKSEQLLKESTPNIITKNKSIQTNIKDDYKDG